MKVMIMNDRKSPMLLKVQDVVTAEVELVSIGEAQAKVVELNLPENSIPYFKIWENNVAFLSSINKDTAKEIA
jgi:hypothetical protein